MQHPPESQIDSVKLNALQMLLQTLQDHVTTFDLQMNALKLLVNTNLRATEIKLHACVNENAQMQVRVQILETQSAGMTQYLAGRKTIF